MTRNIFWRSCPWWDCWVCGWHHWYCAQPQAQICLFRHDVKECCHALCILAFNVMGLVPDIVGYVKAQLSQYTYTFPCAPRVSCNPWSLIWCLVLLAEYWTQRSSHALEALSQWTHYYSNLWTLFHWRLWILCQLFQGSVPNIPRKWWHPSLWSSNAYGCISVYCSMTQSLWLVRCLLNQLAICQASWVEDRGTGSCGIFYHRFSQCILWPYWDLDPHQGQLWGHLSHNDGRHIYKGEVRVCLL